MSRLAASSRLQPVIVIAVACVGMALAAGCKDEPPPPSASAGAASSSAAAADTAAAPRASAGGPKAPHPNVLASRALVKRFGVALKQALMAGLSSGGPDKAVGVCNVKAPQIAQELKPDKGWSIRRTSLKLRNKNNAPDNWERATLENFQRQKEGGLPIELMEASAMVDGRFRYMKAIGTASLCLNCHGSDLPKELSATIDKLYPDDAARGYQVGDIRGAFSVTREVVE